MKDFSTTIGLSSGESMLCSVESGEIYMDQNVNVELIQSYINDNLTSSKFRIYVLYPDETIAYEIPPVDIKVGGSYNENYQNGQRRTLSFTLYNESGDYTPNINTFWAGTRLKLEQGLELLDGTIIWFSKGIYIINQISPSLSASGKEVSISANDKFGVFEGNTGKLESTYEIPTGSVIEDVIKDCLLKSMGNGAVLDPKPFIYHSSFKGKVVQSKISKSAGDTFGSILTDLATQLSAEVFYNSQGNLVFVPIVEISDDANKPLLYNFNTMNGDINQLNLSFDYNNIINRVIVISNTSNGGVYKAIKSNDDPSSPLSYQRIGYRTGNIINDSNITSNVTANERADYELRQQLILKSTLSASVVFNPLLEVNNLIAVTDEFFELINERFLIQSISCSLDYSGQMSITFSNLRNLPFIVK